MKKGRSFFQHFNRYQNKISFIAFTSVFISLLLMITVSYSGINELYDSTSDEMERGLTAVNQDHLSNYMNISADYIDSRMQTFFAEQATLAEIYQTILDHDTEFAPILPPQQNTALFSTNLSYNGRWYQNPKDETSSVLVPRYLQDHNQQIKPEVQTVIHNSAMFNLLMPAFYHHGANKLWLYYVGPKDQEILRTVPWNDSGSAMDQIYPAFTDSPIWEAFSPGLVSSWEHKISDPTFDKNKLTELAIMKPPSQDGFTGKTIITLNYPVWDRLRSHFLGSVSVDVELNEIIQYTRDLKLARSGFAFISQSNGNVFALNANGEEILGLKNAQDSTVLRKSGAEYNPMLRFFKDSIYDSVRKLQLATTADISQQELRINGIDYIVLQKNLKPVKTWSQDKGLHKDTWVLGFVIPKQELYATFYTVQKQVKNSGKRIIYNQFIIVSLFIALAAVAINFMASRMTKDLTQLQEAASAIARADYDMPIVVTSQDEIGSLAVTINHMRNRIKQSFGELTEKNEILNRYALRLAKLHEIDSAILTKQPLHTIVQVSLKHLATLIPCQRASCAIADPSSTSLTLLAVLTERPSAIPTDDTAPLLPNLLSVMQTGNVLIVNDLSKLADLSEEHRLLLSEGFHSYLRVPLVLDGTLLGCLNFSALSPHAFNQTHSDLIHEVASSITIALHQTRLQEKIKTYNAELERRIHELEIKNAEMERFTYTVSHDLKSPLITIKGFLGMLTTDAKAGKVERMESDIKRITNAADKMQTLLEDLLELSRVGRVSTPASVFPISETVQEAGELLYGGFTTKNIFFEIANDMPLVRADRSRICEVWQNLLENAVKYMGNQPSPHIVAGWLTSKDGPIFFVKDNGIGIESAYQHKIFDLFEKLNPHSEGTGIGLALVKRIIELHNGKIWVESLGIDQGSTFYFTLPTKEDLT